MIVCKFGGSSVRDARCIERVVSIIEGVLSDAPVLISSAMGDTTDSLLTLREMTLSSTREEVRRARKQLIATHMEALNAVTTGAPHGVRDRWYQEVSHLSEELSALLQGLVLIGDVSDRSTDTLLSFGERLSTAIICACAQAHGIETTLIDSRTVVRTGTTHGNATPDLPTSYRLIAKAVRPAAGRLTIAQGFLGSTDEGRTTTLGRGGSDYTATIFGAALGAQRVEIWTDVDGIMTCDPRKIPRATTVEELSYAEAAELAYFGAKVIHPATMIPAVEKRIPIVVCNTQNPTGPRSVITSQPSSTGLRALAGRTGVTVLTVHSSRMLNAYGYLSRIFAVFESHQMSVDLIATSEVSVSVSLDSPTVPHGLVEELSRWGEVEWTTDRAVVSLVGEKLWKNPRVIHDVFSAVDQIAGQEVEMISLGSSNTNLSFVIAQERYDRTMEALHAKFFD